LESSVILLDTHVLVWLALQPNKLSKNAKEAIRAARLHSHLAVAAITLWELAWLAENGLIVSTMSIESFIRECVSKVSVLPITPEIAVRAVSFPESYPKDPQDRLIGATALVEGTSLVTHDDGIAKSGLVPVIW
jgi:PIN domain nuclease of toxin-antitoxin system